MNRKLFHNAHYNVIAKRIRETRHVFSLTNTKTGEGDDQFSTGAQRALDMVVRDLALWFAEDNPDFDQSMWMEATNTNG